MGVHKQIRFEVKPGSIDACVDAIREYAEYVREWVGRGGPECA
jgi:hypothetical protein